ncbi:hypothetical protein [Prosthecobacter vanneervenii]|uniref:Uncharacterized protein n=1 Tax=Prosthecobacter vanneervenii TaxID=48466 RepID=A0A7W7YDY6_9BACT|nr:hypothetical protein [Prosthecobacter vanneervenii]MBB5034411.1 hypothetical protein [Prosthecobacter vanneervenii]
MKQKLEVIELAALRIASGNELPRSTADNLNLLLGTLVNLLRRQQDEIEILKQRMAHDSASHPRTVETTGV